MLCLLVWRFLRKEQEMVGIFQRYRLSAGSLPIQINGFSPYYYADQGLGLGTDRVIDFFDQRNQTQTRVVNRVLRVLLIL